MPGSACVGEGGSMEPAGTADGTGGLGPLRGREAPCAPPEMIARRGGPAQGSRHRAQVVHPMLLGAGGMSGEGGGPGPGPRGAPGESARLAAGLGAGGRRRINGRDHSPWSGAAAGDGGVAEREEAAVTGCAQRGVRSILVGPNGRVVLSPPRPRPSSQRSPAKSAARIIGMPSLSVLRVAIVPTPLGGWSGRARVRS